MKKIIVIVICLVFISIAHAQDIPSCDSVYLQTTSNVKTTDPCLLKATTYVLAHPLSGNSKLYYNYMGFILSWMDKTPDFTFNLNDKIVALCKDENLSLFNVYITCLAKAAIENKKEFVPIALKLFVSYLEAPENKVKSTAKIKKMIRDVRENKIDKYI